MINLGQVNNQNFSLIPYNLFINFVKYKALSKGINFILVEESYTSKTSFLDKEILYSFTDKNKEKPEDYKFLGKRIKRGLFKTQHNKLINADINGAYNILRKV